MFCNYVLMRESNPDFGACMEKIPNRWFEKYWKCLFRIYIMAAMSLFYSHGWLI